MSLFFRAVLAVLAIASYGHLAGAATATVAVASNFAETAEALGREFEEVTMHKLVFVRGSSGGLFAQIVNRAPIDVFLSADAERPRQLEARELAPPGAGFTYAIGQLVLWSRDTSASEAGCLGILSASSGKVAIANPRLAPYGHAAQQFLERKALWALLQPRLVLGENIAQTLQFAASGSASVALVAKSQLRNPQLPAATCSSDVPAEDHAPIEQVGVVTVSGAHNRAATEFVAFIQSRPARKKIREHGYLLPDRRDDHASVSE